MWRSAQSSVLCHGVVIEGAFEADDAGGARFHEAQGVGPETIAEIQIRVRRVCCMLVREHDEAAFGEYRIKLLELHGMRRIAAGRLLA
jgi:hypothetical protein